MASHQGAPSSDSRRIGPWRDRLIILGVAILGLVALPAITEGVGLAYAAFVGGGLLSATSLPVLQRRLSPSMDRPAQLGVGAIAGLVLVVTSLDSPVVEAAFLGIVVGGLIGIALFGRLRPPG
jgi:hypothetical protein